MNRCFQLAGLGAGNVAPNPLVGAVLVHNDLIISEGYHMKYGGPHAEVMALNPISDASILAQSTLYVNLEPCSHTGKTPPCTDLIISKGIKHVVISNKDPYIEVNGRGIKQLRKAGIEVTEGVMEKEGRQLNRRFFTFHTKKRPYIILKWAQTKNGFMAPEIQDGTPKGITWISNPTSRLLVHRWRSEEQAILAGSGTVENDNPKLTVRGITGTNPVRIVIDPELKLSKDYHVFDGSVKTIIFNFLKHKNSDNNYYYKIEETEGIIPAILNALYDEKIQSVIIEGGANTFSHFIKSGFWDEARVFTAPFTFDQGIPAPKLKGLIVENRDVAGDLLTVYFNKPSV